MALRPYIALCFAALLLAGCLGGGNEPPKISHHQISAEPLKRESVYYTQVESSSDATLGAIYHINVQGEATLLTTNVDRAFWKDFVLALTGVAGNVGAAAVHGISFKAAKTAISNTSTATGGSATNTNTNSATGGTVCTESNAGDLAGCVNP